jgi:hypothetical protein
MSRRPSLLWVPSTGQSNDSTTEQTYSTVSIQGKECKRNFRHLWSLRTTKHPMKELVVTKWIITIPFANRSRTHYVVLVFHPERSENQDQVFRSNPISQQKAHTLCSSFITHFHQCALQTAHGDLHQPHRHRFGTPVMNHEIVQASVGHANLATGIRTLPVNSTLQHHASRLQTKH